jgi:hypothetical protein
MFKKFRLEIIAALISLAVNMSLGGIYQFFPNQGAWFIGSAVVVTSMIVFLVFFTTARLLRLWERL